MWIGHGYYKYLSQKKLSDYSNCYENVETERRFKEDSDD